MKPAQKRLLWKPKSLVISDLAEAQGRSRKSLTLSDLRALFLTEASGARLENFAPANLFGVLRVDGLVQPLVAHHVKLRPRTRVSLENLLTTNHISHNKKQYTTEYKNVNSKSEKN